jgi:hypothetical protein
MDLNVELDRIIQLAQDAKAALADEHEGNFTRSVYEMGVHCDKIEELVADW